MPRELALLPAALTAWAAAWWVTHSTTHWWIVVVAIGGLVAALTIVLAHRRGRVSPVQPAVRVRGRAQAPRTTSTGISAAVALVAVVLVVCSALLRAPVREPEILVQLADRGASVQLTATLTGQLRAGDSTVRAVLDSVAVGAGAPVRLSSPVTVFLDGGSGAFGDTAHGPGAVGSTGMGIGAVVALRGELSRSPPGEADAFLVSAEGALRLQSPPPALWDWANALRAGLSDAATRLPGEGGALLPGLAVGDTGAVSDDLDQAMKDSSLSHLTAVSGANCAIVVAAVMGLCALCGARRAVRLVAGAVALLFFVVLVTPDGSVLRASVMASVWILASGMNRGGSGLSTLALAVLALLVNDPWLASNYGFILSALATAGLLVLTRPLSRVLARVMPVPLAAALAIPLAAQVACQPVLILLSPSVSAYSVPANLLAAPAAPVATIVGMLACVALPLLPWLGTALLWVGWLPATWIAGLAHFWAGLPGALVPWPAEGWGFALAVVVIAAGLWLLIGPRTSPVRRRAQAIALSRRLIVIVAVVGCSVWGGTVAGGQISRAGSMPDQWFLAACDVGQGDALILRAKPEPEPEPEPEAEANAEPQAQAQAQAEDAGDVGAGSNGDGAQGRAGPVYIGVDTGPDPEAYADCLDELGIQRLDLLILSHFDADHVGGVDAVMGRVGSVLAPPAGPGVDGRGTGVGANPAGLAVLSSFERSGAEIDIAARGDAGSVAGWAWQVLWPKTSAVSDYGSNDQSVTVRAENTEGNSILFTGDLSEEGQQQMMAGVTLEPVQIIKVAHHGSADQSPILYRKATASVGVISVGADNTYGHPRDSLLDILRAEGTTILRTDTSGLILLTNTHAADGSQVVQSWSER